MKKHLSTILLVIVLLAGLSLLLYPTFADYWNSLHQSRAVASYAEDVAHLSPVSYDEVWQAATEYNRALRSKPNRYALTDEEKAAYSELLNVGGNGVMAVVEIPKINCRLPVYHGTDEAVLQVAVGHIEGTSLPVGGLGTHTVLSGHRGLPSARLFTDLDQIVVGDTFMIHVLEETLTYQVDQIVVVLPNEISELEIQPAYDYCTLITCTPYGVNSHRMLVRGHRIPTPEDAVPITVSSDAEMIDEWMVVPFVAVPILVVLFIIMLYKTRKKSEEKE